MPQVSPIEVPLNGPAKDLDPGMLKPEHAGKVMVGGAYLSIESIRRAQQLGIKTPVAGGLDDSVLMQLLGYDLGVGWVARCARAASTNCLAFSQTSSGEPFAMPTDQVTRIRERAHIVKVRSLPLKGRVVAKKGDQVQAETVVARTELPGNVQPVKAAS